MMDIYGTATPYLPQLLDFVMDRVRDLSNKEVAADRPKLYEHLIGRVKAQATRLVWKKNAAARVTRSRRNRP